MAKQRKTRQDIENEARQQKLENDEDGEEIYLPEFIEQVVFSALSEQEGFSIENMPDLIFSLVDIAAKWHTIIGGSVSDFNSATAEVIGEYDKNRDELIAAFKKNADSDDLIENESIIDFGDENESSAIETQIKSVEEVEIKEELKKAKKEAKKAEKQKKEPKSKATKPIND